MVKQRRFFVRHVKSETRSITKEKFIKKKFGLSRGPRADHETTFTGSGIVESLSKRKIQFFFNLSFRKLLLSNNFRHGEQRHSSTQRGSFEVPVKMVNYGKPMKIQALTFPRLTVCIVRRPRRHHPWSHELIAERSNRGTDSHMITSIFGGCAPMIRLKS